MPFVQSCGLQLRISQASASSYAAGYSGLRQPQQQAAVKHHGSLSMAPLRAPAVEAAFRVTTIRCADAGTHCLHLCNGWLPCLAAGSPPLGPELVWEAVAQVQGHTAAPLHRSGSQPTSLAKHALECPTAVRLAAAHLRRQCAHFQISFPSCS